MLLVCMCVCTGLNITGRTRPKSDHFWLIAGHLCLWSDIMSYQLVSNMQEGVDKIWLTEDVVVFQPQHFLELV